MGDSEAIAEKDDSPATATPRTDADEENDFAPEATKEPVPTKTGEEAERDEFGLPVRSKVRRQVQDSSDSEDGEPQNFGTPGEERSRAVSPHPQPSGRQQPSPLEKAAPVKPKEQQSSPVRQETETTEAAQEKHLPVSAPPILEQIATPVAPATAQQPVETPEGQGTVDAEKPSEPFVLTDAADRPREDRDKRVSGRAVVRKSDDGQYAAVSEFSHQALATREKGHEKGKEEDEWKTMPAFAPFDLYDDDNRLVAREEHESDNEANAYSGLGGAGKGYTRVQADEDAKSATSMDDNTDYLFKQKGTALHDEDDEQRDPLAQLQATKTLLSEGQRIAYAGVTRLAMVKMVKDLDTLEVTKNTKKQRAVAVESTKMWSQKIMVRLYGHMDIDTSEQVMIEQLADHGVEPEDLTPALMQNARVKNPMADKKVEETLTDAASSTSPKPEEASADSASLKSPKLDEERRASSSSPQKSDFVEEGDEEPLPEYKEHEDEPMPEVRSPSQLGTSINIDIDLRWTVLCDLFLVLIADSIYDSRSRVLLETVGESLKVPWLDICRFEKRVTDSLEMQETANKETWDEADHLENRRKQALKKRYMMMGLATVGGSLVIGLSAGALAPLIGAGLAAGFTTIGVAGTSGFLAGAGGTALITSGAVITGGTIGVKASSRRMGHVKTFEYRPLHNNKRVNLIVTISGWMNGKIDDVRLPYSTIDPVMGDMYSVLWEPEMLTSMGDTINILATEALTQTVQQVLGSTVLIALMASLQLPIVLTKLSYLIDNPWTVSMGRANAAGLILADSLIDRNLGARPITLVGFSLGARVIFAALRELANRGAYGVVQNVYLFGSPIIANKDEYLRARSVVSGRFINGYATNDWILGYLFRATGGGLSRVAGLAKVEGITGLENVDVTKLVNGHMAYRTAMPKLLRLVGWEVESDEFTEIEDPDPENHQARQRELIKEIDDARKTAEEKPEKRRFGFFRKGKLAEKKGWETYDDKMKSGEDDFGTAAAEEQGNVLFDIEAIKRELASEQIEVKQLESTLPPIKLSVNDFKSPGGQTSPRASPYSNLRETKSYDGAGPSGSNRPSRTEVKANGQTSQSSLPNGQNPFNQGYDEYNFSHEAIASNGLASADHGKISFDQSELGPSPMCSPHSSQGSPGLQPESPLRQEVEKTSDPGPRPTLRSATTAPIPASPPPPAIDHNAWVDEQDEDFGQEKEVTMSFG